MPPISSMDELVAEIDDLAAALARNSTAVTRASIDRWFIGPDATISYIPSIRMEWKVSFVKTGSSSLFWFFNKVTNRIATTVLVTWIDNSIAVSFIFRNSLYADY